MKECNPKSTDFILSDEKPVIDHDEGPILPKPLRDKRGRVIWKLPGNKPEQNEQLGVRDIQALFLERFPEFKEQFLVSDENGELTIPEPKREEAKKFILESVGNRKKFIVIFGGSPITQKSVSYFKGSSYVVLEKFLVSWGLIFDFPKPTPEGWRTKEALYEQLGITYNITARIADQYRTEHPEWFRMFRIQGGRREYFAPELVEAIIGILSERNNRNKNESISPEEARRELWKYLEEE